MAEAKRIAFIGTGIMGGHMARRLAEAGHQVAAWNRSRGKAEALADSGVTVADSSSAAAEGADFAVLMLSDGPTCSAILEGGVYDALARPGGVIVMSSTDLASAREQERQCRERGLGFVDAPVSGGEKGAREGNLSIMCGGSEEDYAAAEGMLRAMGAPLLVGPAGSGQLTKLSNQLIVALTICAVSEGFVLAKEGGADLGRVREALLGGFCRSTILEQHGLRMIEEDFEPGGPAVHQLKDLRGIRDAARELGISLPLLELAEGVFERLVAEGHGGRDHSYVYKIIEESART